MAYNPGIQNQAGAMFSQGMKQGSDAIIAAILQRGENKRADAKENLFYSRMMAEKAGMKAEEEKRNSGMAKGLRQVLSNIPGEDGQSMFSKDQLEAMGVDELKTVSTQWAIRGAIEDAVARRQARKGKAGFQERLGIMAGNGVLDPQTYVQEAMVSGQELDPSVLTGLTKTSPAGVPDLVTRTDPQTGAPFAWTGHQWVPIQSQAAGPEGQVAPAVRPPSLSEMSGASKRIEELERVIGDVARQVSGGKRLSLEERIKYDQMVKMRDQLRARMDMGAPGGHQETGGESTVKYRFDPKTKLIQPAQ